MSARRSSQVVLILFIAYCVDLIWKLAHWSDLARGSQWWMIALALTVRFAVMSFLLVSFMRLRKAVAITRSASNTQSD